MNKRFLIYTLTVFIAAFLYCKKNNHGASDNYSHDSETIDQAEKRAEPVATVEQVHTPSRKGNTDSTFAPASSGKTPTKTKDPFRLVKSDRFGTTVRFSLPDYGIEEVELSNGESYAVVEASGTTHPSNEKGMPSLPFYKQRILIPNDVDPKLVVSDTKYRTESIIPIPAVGPIKKKQQLPEPTESEFYNSGSIYPENRVMVSEPYDFRSVRAVNVYVYPFAYDSAEKTVRVYENLEFSIRTEDATEIIMPEPLVVEDFVRSAEENFINYESSAAEYEADSRRALPAEERGAILIIYPEKFTEEISDFVLWKKKIGFSVELAVYPYDTGSTYSQIKNYIATKNGVSHIILMGDATDIPSIAYYTGTALWSILNYDVSKSTDVHKLEDDTAYKLYSDMSYAGIDPRDNDVTFDYFISRISTTSETELETQLNKIVSYERGDSIEANPQWLNSVLLTGSTGYSSFYKKTDWQFLNDQETELKNWDYNKFYKVYDPNAKVADVIAALNSGAGLTYYLGHGSRDEWITTGFNAENIDQISGGHPTLSIQPVCDTGGFFGNCLAESQMNSPSFIGVMASTNQTWWNPPMVQIDEFSNNIVADNYSTVGGMIFDSIQEAVDWAGADEEKETASQLHYFGDCSMGFRTRQPIILDVSVRECVNQGTPFSVQVTSEGNLFANAIVTFSQGNSIIDTQRPPSGSASFIAPSEEGSYRITVWERNAIVVEKELIVKPVYTICNSTFEANSDVMNLNAVVPGTPISTDNPLFSVENGILKAAAYLEFTEPITINVTYLDKGTGAQQQTTITIEYTGANSYEFQLAQGWNLLGSPVNSTTSAQDIFKDSENRQVIRPSLFYWDRNASLYSEDDLSGNLIEQTAFWAYGNATNTSTSFSGSGEMGAMTGLNTGWNLYSPATYHPYPSGAMAIWQWNSEAQHYDQLTGGELLEPLKGYWVFMMQ